MRTPVLLLIYNRPDLTKRTFAAIRKAAPEKLFIAADGPNSLLPLDYEKCDEARKLATQIDWNCQVKTFFRNSNLGLEKAVSLGIRWFFESVEEGIILEDDCLPHESFFKYCEELLEKYRFDERVMLVSGNNFNFKHIQMEYSYTFSKYALVWGWATWRRAWEKYDSDMALWPVEKENLWARNNFLSSKAVDYWSGVFQDAYDGKINSWANKWTFSCWVNNGLTVVPCVNLASNIGFGPQATHTTFRNDSRANFPVKEINFPLIHPPVPVQNRQLDSFLQRKYYDHSLYFFLRIKTAKFVKKFMPKSLAAFIGNYIGR